jgi:tetratricopeptide (TPR) repeat protein
MLTTQKRVLDVLLPVLIAALLAWVTGCTPAGSRAMQEGEKLRLQGKAAEAVEMLMRGATLLRTNAQAWNRVGMASHAAGQATNALKAYHQALVCARDRDPETIADVRYNLGCLHLEQGNAGAAESELSAYTLLRPKSVEGWNRLATAQLRGKRLEQAERSLAQALALDRRDTDALNGVGVLMVHKRRPRDAYAYFASALMIQANHPAALLNLAVVSHRQLNLKPLALQKYKEYLAIEPRPSNWDAVNAVASQLQSELKPPPPPALVVTNTFLTNAIRAVPAPAVTNAPAPAAAPTNTARPTPPAPVAEPPKTPAASAKPVPTPAATSSPPPLPAQVPAPAVQLTNPAVSATPPPPAPPTNSVVSTPPPEPAPQEPPAKVEEVRLPEAPEPKIGAAVPREDPKTQEEPKAAQPEPAPEPSPADAPPAAQTSPPEPQPPVAVPPPSTPKKPGLLSRMNPVRWFGGGNEVEPKRSTSTIPLPGSATDASKHATHPQAKETVLPVPAPPTSLEVPAKPTPANRPVVPRYKRGNPAAPAAGDRGAAETQFNLGLDAHRKGQWRDAIEGYSRAVSSDPAFYEAQHNLALASLNGGDISRALVAGETALAIRKEPEARYNFALILQRAGFPLDAAEELDALIQGNPEHIGAHFLLGNLWAQDLQDPSQARPHYRKVLELEPNHPQAVSIRYWLAAHP